MSTDPRATVSVNGRARVRRRPSFLLMIGRIHASEATLDLALSSLRQKRSAVTSWLERLGGQQIEFGAPRFPEQVEMDPMRMAQRLTQLRTRRGGEPPRDAGKKSVLVSYSVLWPIHDKSADEVLVFVDRIQFETADEDESEAEAKEPAASWDTDPMEQIQSMMANMTEPAETQDDEQHFFFLSELSAEDQQNALTRAFQDGQVKAEMVARAAGAELGRLKSLHGSHSDTDTMHNVNQMQRRATIPLIAETPFAAPMNQQISESPQPVEFTITVHLTYELASDPVRVKDLGDPHIPGEPH